MTLGIRGSLGEERPFSSCRLSPRQHQGTEPHPSDKAPSRAAASSDGLQGSSVPVDRLVEEAVKLAVSHGKKALEHPMWSEPTSWAFTHLYPSPPPTSTAVFLCLLKGTEVGLGDHRQGRSAPGQGRGRTPRHRLQAGVQKGHQAAGVPRPEDSPPQALRQPLPAQRPAQVRDLRPTVALSLGAGLSLNYLFAILGPPQPAAVPFPDPGPDSCERQ